MLVVGVDGWRGGWVAVTLTEGSFERALAAKTFREVLAAFPAAEAIGVDIPIGLPPPYPRRADGEARRFLGVRAPVVFPAYPPAVYRASAHAEASRRAFELVGLGIGQQAWRIGPKILEVEKARTDRIFEVHPEVSFRALTEGSLPPKKTWAGQMLRLRALARAGIRIPAQMGAALVPPDDVLDAAVAAWSALRIARGEARTLPERPKPGEPRIWY